jgi:hypothetical protein
MRALKRRWRAEVAEWRLRRRRNEIAEQLREQFDMPSPPRLVERRNLGHDSNYLVYARGERMGVLRLVNPHKRRPQPVPGMPFLLAEVSRRLDQEWEALNRGAEAGITPVPLWRTEDALLCRYLPYEPLVATAQREPDRVWELLCEASAALDRLHREVGIAHMDSSLSNILSDADRSRFAVVDFEYTAVPELSFAQQKLYDHLRLLHCSWKYVKNAQRYGYRRWFDQFAEYVDDDMRTASLREIAAGITNVLGEPAYRAELRHVLENVP